MWVLSFANSRLQSSYWSSNIHNIVYKLVELLGILVLFGLESCELFYSRNNGGFLLAWILRNVLFKEQWRLMVSWICFMQTNHGVWISMKIHGRSIFVRFLTSKTGALCNPFCLLSFTEIRQVKLNVNWTSALCGNQSHISVHWRIRVPSVRNARTCRCRDCITISCVPRATSWLQICTVSQDLCGCGCHSFVVMFLFCTALCEVCVFGSASRCRLFLSSVLSDNFLSCNSSQTHLSHIIQHITYVITFLANPIFAWQAYFWLSATCWGPLRRRQAAAVHALKAQHSVSLLDTFASPAHDSGSLEDHGVAWSPLGRRRTCVAGAALDAPGRTFARQARDVCFRRNGGTVTFIAGGPRLHLQGRMNILCPQTYFCVARASLGASGRTFAWQARDVGILDDPGAHMVAGGTCIGGSAPGASGRHFGWQAQNLNCLGNRACASLGRWWAAAAEYVWQMADSTR